MERQHIHHLPLGLGWYVLTQDTLSLERKPRWAGPSQDKPTLIGGMLESQIVHGQVELSVKLSSC